MGDYLFAKRWIRICTLYLLLHYYTLVRGKLSRLNVGKYYPIKNNDENMTYLTANPGTVLAGMLITLPLMTADQADGSFVNKQIYDQLTSKIVY